MSVKSGLDHLAVVHELLTHGALPNEAVNEGVTPLFIAAENGNLEIVCELLTHGALPDQADHEDITPVFIAAQNGYLEVVRELLAQGASPNQADNEGTTPLFTAVQKGHLDIVQLFIADEKTNLSIIVEDISASSLAQECCHTEILAFLNLREQLDMLREDINLLPTDDGLLASKTLCEARQFGKTAKEKKDTASILIQSLWER